MERANATSLRDFLEQGRERRGSERIVGRDRAGGLERVAFAGRIERRQQQIIIGKKRAALAPELPDTGLQQVAGPRRGRLDAVGDAVEQIGVDWSGDFTIVAEHIFPDLVRNGAIALLAHDVQYGLGHDELCERAHDDGIAELAAYPRRLLEDLRQPMADPTEEPSHT